MTGYQSKRAAAQDKLDDDDIQVYKRTWIDLTPQDLNEIFAIARTGEHAVRLALDKIKEKNNGT